MATLSNRKIATDRAKLPYEVHCYPEVYNSHFTGFPMGQQGSIFEILAINVAVMELRANGLSTWQSFCRTFMYTLGSPVKLKGLDKVASKDTVN